MTEAGKVTVPVELDGKGAESGADSLLASLGEKFGKLKDVLAFAGVGLGIAEIGKQLFDVGEEFAAASHTIQRDTGLTGRALDHLVAQSQKVATTVPTSFQTSAEAISLVRQRLGETGPELTRTTEQMIALAKITGGDVTTTINESATALERWGIPASRSRSELDLLFRAAQQTGVSFDDLATRTGQAATVMQDLGFSFDQTAVIVARLEQTGTNTSQVLAGLRAGLAKTAKAGKDPQQAFDRLATKIKDAGSASEATRLAVERFGSRAGPELAKAIREGVFATDSLFNSIKNGKETIRGTEEQTRSFGDEWTIFSNKVKLAVEPLATTVLARLNTALQFVGDNIGTVVAAGQKLVGFMSGLPGKITLVAGAATAGAEAFVLIGDAIEKTAAAFRTLAEVDVAALIIANPWVVAGAAIAGVAAAILIFNGHTSKTAAVAQAATTAIGLLRDAMDNLKHATLDTKQAQLDHQNAIIGVHDAALALTKLIQEHVSPTSERYRKAVLQLQGAQLQSKATAQEVNDALAQQARAQAANATATGKAIDKIRASSSAFLDLSRHTGQARGQIETATQRIARMHDGLQQWTAALRDNAGHLEIQAERVSKTNPILSAARQKTAEYSVATAILTDKLGHVPTQKQINVFFKTHPSLLAQQVTNLAHTIQSAALDRHPDLSINWGTPPPVWWKPIFPGVPGAATFPHHAAHGAVVSRPTVMLVGENPSTSPEVISPVKMLREIVREESSGVGEVRVFIGDQELTDIVRTEVVSHDRASATRVRAGRLFGGIA